MVWYRESVAAVIEDFHFEDSRFLDAGRKRVRPRLARPFIPSVYRRVGAPWQSTGSSSRCPDLVLAVDSDGELSPEEQERL